MKKDDLICIAMQKLMSVLCDPEGKCCMHGSDKDRRIVNEALEYLRQALDKPKPELDEFCRFNERLSRALARAYGGG